MRLLVTRAMPDAEETARHLRALGHEPVVAPLSRIVFADLPAGQPVPEAIVATSRNAVRALASWKAAGAWRDATLFAVGEATAAEARRADFTNVRTGGGDGAALGRLIVEALRPGAHLLYPAARDRSTGLEEALAAAGIAVDIVMAYRAETVAALPAPATDGLRSGAIDGALFHSRRNAAAFCDLVTRAGLVSRLAGRHLYAVSARVAEPLAALGGASLHVADSPDEAGLLALLPRSGKG